KRARALGRHRLLAAADPQSARAQQLAAQHAGCTAVADWRAAVERADVDAVLVSTTNDALAPVTAAALACGKHVLVEKPAARSAEELRSITEAARAAGVVVKVGFNHRFHPALVKTCRPNHFLAGLLANDGRVVYVATGRAA